MPFTPRSIVSRSVRFRRASGLGAVCLLTAVIGFPLAVAAAPRSAPTEADIARLEDELARVQTELRDQRQLILQVMQMHDALLKYLQLGGGAAAGARMPLPSTELGAPPGTPAPTTTAATADSTPAASTRGSISGKIHGGGALGEAYVYLDGPKSIAAHAPTLEVKQLGRQFVPAISIVQVGGRVIFPNEDKVFHNVFSRTPGDAFDLGTLKAGDKPNPVVMLKPGHVEVFCNIHAKMRADILVVPNSHWARVRPDGSFQLPGIPVGSHNVVLWGPSLKTVSQRVDVTAAGGTATFSTETVTRAPHLNKQGGAYESYEN